MLGIGAMFAVLLSMIREKIPIREGQGWYQAKADEVVSGGPARRKQQASVR